MVEALIKRVLVLPIFLAVLACPTGVQAHQLDEYLQATLVAIEPGQIWLDLNLTPGVAMADKVLGQIDRNHDGVISTDEAAAYAAIVQDDLSVRLDGHSMELKLAAVNFPAPAELRTGWGIIQLEFSVRPGQISAGSHHLIFENRYQPVGSVYLFNAAHPASLSVQITGQQRNEIQSTGEITFSFHPPSNPLKRAGVVVLLAAPLVVLLARGRRPRKRLEEPAFREA
jgi:hypothetical protein